MPAKKKPGIGRINIRCEDWFADRVNEAAKQTDRSLSSYVRIALIEQMKRDGVAVVPPPGEPAEVTENEPVRRRGRPKKGPPAGETKTKGSRKSKPT